MICEARQVSVINDTIILERRKAQISDVLTRIAAVALRIFLESDSLKCGSMHSEKE